MTKAITTKNPPYTQDQISLIKRTVAKDATDDELKLFLIVAARSGLDPFSRQIHFVKRKGQGAFQTGIDGYRAIAERTKTLAGIDDAVFDTETELHPNKASVTIYRMIGGQRVPFTASARWSEYVPAPGQDFMWKKMPYLMLGKVAEALALRKAFPNDLSGLYTNEEMAQADHGQPVEQATVIEQEGVQIEEEVQPSDTYLDFVSFLEAVTTIEEYNEAYKAISEAKESQAISADEFKKLVSVAKETIERLKTSPKKEPEVKVTETEIVEPKEESGFAKAVKKTSGASFVN